ncbi:glycosyltransferase family 1 protein [Hypoxylon crocopeplum]|nr:glycosyltransferase family 1 protein [Hypoxylon crocopeplum]
MSTERRPDGDRRIAKFAFVTVGASASFKSLIKEIISDAFVAKLEALGFTHLIVQCGPDFGYFQNARPTRDAEGLIITGFSFDNDILMYMGLTTADDTAGCERSQGLIITHAGSGSILDALDFNTTLIAVPNPALMGNHQSEIAEEMEKQGFLIQGKVGSLINVVNEDNLNAPKKQWPPDPDPDSVWPGGLWDVINALMPTRRLG